MALIGSNKGIVKNDINFFAAFTASARKQAQALAAVAAVSLIFVGVTLGILAYQGFKYLGLKSNVDGLKAELAKPEYQALDAEAASLQAEVTSRTQYLYTLSAMRKTVDEVPSSSVSLVELLGDNIPNDAYIYSYDFTGTEGEIIGYAFNYYSALDMVNKIQASDVFASPDIEIVRYVPDTGSEEYVEGVLYVDACYQFTISGNLTSDIYVSLTRFYDDGVTVTALSGIETVAVRPGTAYEVTNIAAYGDEYVLTSVKIDGTEVTAEELASFIASDSISGISQRNVSIECYYSLAAAAEGSDA